MLKNEDYKLIAVISSEGTGKSTFINDKIIKSRAYDWKKQRCLIITESDPKAYSSIKRVHTYEELQRLKTGIVKFWDWENNEIEMMLKIRSLYQSGALQNGLLVLEDTTIYLGSNVPREIKSLVISRRMNKVDVVVASHSFSDFPSFLRRRTQHYIIGKMQEDLEEKNIELLKYPQSNRIYKAYLSAKKSTNRDVKVLVNQTL